MTVLDPDFDTYAILETRDPGHFIFQLYNPESAGSVLGRLHFPDSLDRVESFDLPAGAFKAVKVAYYRDGRLVDGVYSATRTGSVIR
jgi:hypothetical protein